jgi:uncharacterized protein (DUF1330 family)
VRVRRQADWTQPEDLQINIAAFPSLEQAHAWYSSPEYAKALAFRKVAVLRRLFFVQGTDGPPAASARRGGS